MFGAVVSSIVNVAVEEVALPQASVAVNVTEAVPVFPQASLSAVKLFVQVTLEHISEAAAPPFEANQAVKAAVLPFPSHSTVAFAAAVSIVGAVVSSIVNVAVEEVAFPQASVAVKVTEAVPVFPQASLRDV